MQFIESNTHMVFERTFSILINTKKIKMSLQNYHYIRVFLHNLYIVHVYEFQHKTNHAI